MADDPARGIGAARSWLEDEFRRVSAAFHGGKLEVSAERHRVGPGRRVPDGAEIVNVVALRRGLEPRRLIVISGHYDSRCSDPMDARSDAPGANDDASGVAVALECARLLGALEPRASIAFVAVAGEEQGLLGSNEQARAWRDAGFEVEAFVTCDIVGGARGSNGRLEPQRVRLFSEGVPSAGPRIVGSDNDAPSRQLARYLESCGEAAVPGFDVQLVFRQDRFLRGGDHKPFNDLGIAAVRFTEPNENYAQQHQDVRVVDRVQYGDLPEFVDFEYVARVADVCAAGIASLALAPPPPCDVTMDAAELTPDTALSWSRGDRVAAYRVRARRTFEPTWTRTIDVGATDRAVLRGYSKDDWLFAVEAVGADGAASLPVYPSVRAR